MRYSVGTLPTAKRYAGQRMDVPSGLDYDAARYYDSGTAQFASADTTSDPGNGLNRLAYVGGNPETRTDSTGHIITSSHAAGGFSTMKGPSEVRIPAKRSRLLIIFGESGAGALFALIMFLGLGSAAIHAHGLNFAQTFLLVSLLLAGLITVPCLTLIALWALVRLVTNLPAIILLPDRLINHSIVFHVVLPWHEIESFTFFEPGTRSYKFSTISVLFKSDDRVYAMQQPLTRVLLRLFSSLCPTNIDAGMTALSQEEMWSQLQQCVRAHVPNERIRFDTVRPRRSA